MLPCRATRAFVRVRVKNCNQPKLACTVTERNKETPVRQNRCTHHSAYSTPFQRGAGSHRHTEFHRRNNRDRAAEPLGGASVMP